ASVAEEDKKKQELLRAGKITQKDYNDWRLRKMAMGKRWEEMRDNLAQDYHNANQIAKSIANGYKADVYALNHNYATYQVEHDGGIDSFYSLYDKQTVERLMREDQNLMPPPGRRVKQAIAQGKDVKWNNRQLQSALTQSILQGESIPQIAKRVSETVSTRNYSSAVRYARTMMTGAQNAGRIDAYERAQDMGIDLQKEWMATLDDRTRHSHAMLHGERVPVDEEFSNGCMFPGDPSGDPEEVYNCRCTLISQINGFEIGRVESSPKMGDMSFEEWQDSKNDTSENEIRNADHGKNDVINGNTNGIIDDDTIETRPRHEYKEERGLKDQNETQLLKGIKSHTKNINKHRSYLEDPSKKVPDYYSRDPRYQNGIKEHWRIEIENSERAIQNRKKELKKRGVSYDE
ncbi:MAG: minor capsid protein, partial [Ruminococcus sp.]|nr:minor capsid protein [Ruminococcus sp.]